MIRFTCQHCRRPSTSSGTTIPTVCRFCENLGHSKFRSDCEVCNPTPNGSGGGKHNLSFKQVMKKAA